MDNEVNTEDNGRRVSDCLTVVCWVHFKERRIGNSPCMEGHIIISEGDTLTPRVKASFSCSSVRAFMALWLRYQGSRKLSTMRGV